MPYVKIEMEGYGTIQGDALEVYIEKNGKQIDLTADEIKRRLGKDNEKIIKFFSLFRCKCDNIKIKYLLEKEDREFEKRFGSNYELQNLGMEKYIKDSLGTDCKYF